MTSLSDLKTLNRNWGNVYRSSQAIGPLIYKDLRSYQNMRKEFCDYCRQSDSTPLILNGNVCLMNRLFWTSRMRKSTQIELRSRYFSHLINRDIWFYDKSKFKLPDGWELVWKWEDNKTFWIAYHVHGKIFSQTN